MNDGPLPTPADIVATAGATFPPSPPAPIERCPNDLTWIEVQMLTADGGPASGQRYEIVAPDNGIHAGVLDVNGLVRIDGLTPGTCRISFPDLDRTSWNRL